MNSIKTMNEEEYIRTKISGKTPFKVPEGYFEQLSQSVMSRLPEHQVAKKPTLFVRLRPVLYAAACLMAVIFSVTLYLNTSEGDQADSVIAKESSISNSMSESYVEDAVDYVMADNNDIYACLMGE